MVYKLLLTFFLNLLHFPFELNLQWLELLMSDIKISSRCCGKYLAPEQNRCIMTSLVCLFGFSFCYLFCVGACVHVCVLHVWRSIHKGKFFSG